MEIITAKAPPVLTLRSYQREAVDRVKQGFSQRKGFILIQAATGAGKTIIFCTLIKELLTEAPYLRIAVLAHRRELAAQARDKLLSIWPEAPIGIACSSLSKKSNVKNKVTIGTIQTLARQSKITPFNIIIIDEVHRLPTKEKDSQFGNFLKDMLQLNPGLQVLGVTATPYRLGHGFIFGKYCKTPWANWFEKLSYTIGISRLQDEGFLSPYHYMISDSEINHDLDSLSSTEFGDYRIDQLEKVVIRQQHLHSAVKTLMSHAADRKGIVIFCVSIPHAEMLRDELLKAGIASASVHSEMSIGERDDILNAFDQGEIRILTNVNVLTEGWDSPRADCVMLCRPTLSTALYVQMVGRGLRLHPDKNDCLVLDLAGCFQRHGSIKTPIVRIDNEPIAQGEEKSSEKNCPECSEIIPLSAAQCPYCDRDLKPCVVYVDDEQNMVKIDDHPEDVVLCEECCRPYPWKDCVAEWMSTDLDAATPGVLYCPDEHLIQAMESPTPIVTAAWHEVIEFKSRLNMAGIDMGLCVDILLLDERKVPRVLQLSFGTSERDQEKLQEFVATFCEEVVENTEDMFGLPAQLNRKKWNFDSGVISQKSEDGDWVLKKP
jgi:DNA repair protein RadD